MDIDDDALQALWRRQQPPSQLADEMAARIARHRRADRLRRALEVVLTLAGVALLAWPADDGTLSPAQWLLMPFFAVFLVVSWAVVLGQAPEQKFAASEPVAVYAAIRKVQLRTRLRHLALARMSARTLVGYASVGLVLAYGWGTIEWQHAALRLALWAAVWTLGTHWLVTRNRAAAVSEYRRMSRIAFRDVG